MLIRIGVGAINTFASFLIFQESFELINIRSDWAVIGGCLMILGVVLYFIWSTTVIFPELKILIRNPFGKK